MSFIVALFSLLLNTILSLYKCLSSTFHFRLFLLWLLTLSSETRIWISCNCRNCLLCFIPVYLVSIYPEHLDEVWWRPLHSKVWWEGWWTFWKRKPSSFWSTIYIKLQTISQWLYSIIQSIKWIRSSNQSLISHLTTKGPKCPSCWRTSSTLEKASWKSNKNNGLMICHLLMLSTVISTMTKKRSSKSSRQKYK